MMSQTAAPMQVPRSAASRRLAVAAWASCCCVVVVMSHLLMRLAGGAGDGRRAGGAGDEAQVDGGEAPVAGAADEDQGGAGGFGDRVALIAAAGVVAGGDDRGLAVDAGLDLGQAEAVVPEVAGAVASQPGLPGEDEAERADAGEVVGEQLFEPAGVGGLLGGAPLAEERV